MPSPFISRKSGYLGQFGDELVTLGDGGRCDDLGHEDFIAHVSCVNAERYVLFDAAVEQCRFLGDQANALSQVRNVNLLYVHVIYHLKQFRCSNNMLGTQEIHVGFPLLCAFQTLF